MEELWYKNVAYEDAKELLKKNLVSTVAAFITAGYWLKYIRDNRDYEKDGYQNLWECAEKEFGLKTSEASRAMSMNDKYSVDGNTPFMSESYKSYTKSQLQEMLTMTDEQLGKVMSDMTVKEIREIKKPKEEEQGGQQEELEEFIDSFVQKECKIQPDIRGLTDSPYCSTCGAPLNPPDTEHMSERCCRCGQAVEWSEYIKDYCDVATDAEDSVNTECEEELTEDIFPEIEIIPEEEKTVNIEFDASELLQELDNFIEGEYREIEEAPEADTADMAVESGRPRKCITGWSRYGACSCCGYNGAQCCQQCEEDSCNSKCGWIDEPYIPEQEKTAEPEQPEFPSFKNNTQRKEWLEDVEAWGLWYEDNNIQARYYRYDFPDGSRCIAVKYRYTCPPWMEGERQYKEKDGSYGGAYYHMIYSEEYKKNHKYEYEKYYTHSTVSVSTLVEFIKEISKKLTEAAGVKEK